MNKIIKIIYLKIKLFLISDIIRNAIYLNLSRKEKDEEKQKWLFIEIMNAKRDLNKSKNNVLYIELRGRCGQALPRYYSPCSNMVHVATGVRRL